MSLLRILPVRLARLGAAILAAALWAFALPAAARTMIYVPESYGLIGAYYAVLNDAEGKARLVWQVGARSGSFTDSGTEILVTLSKPLSYPIKSAGFDCTGKKYDQRVDLKKVLFRRVDGSGVNKGKSHVVEIGEVVDVTGCTPGKKTPFGSLSDEGWPAYHRNVNSREPMTGVVAGLTIAGMSESPQPDLTKAPFAMLEEDVVTLETDTTLRFQRSNHVVSATLTSDQWLVLNLSGFKRGYTRFSINTGNGTEIWLEALFKDGKPQTVTNALMTKPLPGASFGTKAQTARMWESFVGLGTNNPFFFYLYGNNKGDRVSKDLAAATESRVPITWRYEGLDVISSRNSGSTLIERRWTALGRTGKYLSVMEQEVHTPSGGSPYFYIPPRVVFYVDRGKAVPPAP